MLFKADKLCVFGALVEILNVSDPSKISAVR